MFLRRKQGSLSFLDLQDIYNDVCTTTIKNHDLEASGHIEEALKGWKALHTTLLYKVDIYEKHNTRPTPEEADLIQELKSIRDENVSHLIRLLVQLKELNGTRKPSVQQNVHSNTSHKLSIPSLRSGSSLDRTLSGNGHQRSLQRTLRNNSYSKSSSKSDIVQAAANISWGLPKPVMRKSPEPGLFDDFDQTETPAANWEKVSPADTTTSSSGSSESLNLIDLNDSNYTYLHDRDDQTSSCGLKGSFDDLSLQRPYSRAPPAPPLPPKNRTPIISADSPKRLQQPYVAMPDMSKQPSSSQLRPPPREQAASPKKYTYTKPKPMNVHEIMTKSRSKSDLRLGTAKPATKSSTAKVASATTKTPPLAKNAPSMAKKLNISYNYKPLERPAGLAGQKTTVVAKKKRAPVLQAKPSNAASPRESRASEEYFSSNGEVEEGEASKQSVSSDEEQAALIKSIKGIDEKAANQILNDIVVRGDPVYWDDVVGLESAKTSLKEAVVYPFLRPDLFRGLREPTRGMLLFGPPGTGKTMLARAVATESKSTFFSISSSSLTSKYLGESEKLVKALFLLARKLSPSIVFIDEIDSILGQRTEGEADSMRRIKNEFLVLWSELSSAAAGRDSSDEDVSRVLILGATNMPWAIDEAARRRFAKRVYIPLPERETRKKQITKLLEFQNHTLLAQDFEDLMDLTEGFSGSDITLLAKDSAMGPLRSLGDKLLSTPTEDIRPIQLEDFIESLKYVRPSVSKEGLGEYETWVSKFGSSGA